MRLIDADKLQKAIPAEEDNITGMGMTYDEMEAYNDGIDEQWKNIVNASTIELKQKKGKWTATYSDCGGDVWVSWKCSNCDYVRKKGWKYTDDGKKPDALFCEICGADMRG